MTTPSTIGRGTTIRGSIRGDGDLDLHGFVEGTVTVKGELLIGETALIKSDVSARRVIVRGAVAGNVSADELVVLEPGARVVGDIGAPQIGIRPGALVRGNVSTGAPLPAKPPQQATALRGRPTATPAPAATARAGTPARPAPAPARPAPAPARPAPAPARPAPVRPAPAPVPVPVAPTPEPTPAPSAVEEAPELEASGGDESAVDPSGGPPPPVLPAVPKGAKAQIRRGRGAK